MMVRMFRTRDPLEAFDRAIVERRKDYAEALTMASRLLFLRAQRESEVSERRALVARLHDRATAAVRTGNSDEARFLLDRKRRLIESIARDESDLKEARADMCEARRRLLDLTDTLDGLTRERRRISACVTTQRLHDATERCLPPRIQVAVDRSRERGAQMRRRLDAARIVDPSDSLSVDLELQSLM